MLSFENELIKIRKDRSISQDMLAKKLGYTRSYICKLEKGERIPNNELVNKLSESLELNEYETNKMLLLAKQEPRIKADKNEYKNYLRLALDFKEAGLIEEAKSVIENSIVLFNGKIETYALLANLHLLNKDYEEAVKINEKALANFPENSSEKPGISKASLIYNLAYVHFEKARQEKLKSEIEIIKSWNSKSEINSDTKDLIKNSLESFNRAIIKFQEAERLEPENRQIKEQLAATYLNCASLTESETKIKNLKKAIYYYDLITDYDYEDFKVTDRPVFMAIGLSKAGKSEEALRQINIMINYNPEYPFFWYAKACILSIVSEGNKEKLEKSYKCLLIALKLNPKLKYSLKWEIDLKELRLSEIFQNKFNSLLE